MKRKAVIAAAAIALVVFLLGIALIFNATDAGRDAGNQAIRKHGGSMDTQQYIMVIDSTSQSYRAAGLAIALTGGFGLCLGAVGLYREL